METIKSTLFEDPMYLYVALVFAELALGALWYERRTRRWLVSLAIPPLLAVGAYALSELVETDREQILRAVDEIAADVQAGRVDALQQWIDDQFAGHFGSKKEAIETARAEIARHPLKDVTVLKGLSLEIVGGRARLHMTTVIQLREIENKMPLIWDIRWIARGDHWRVLEADKPRIGLDLRL
ncbi:MAG: hypothetical protein BWX88_02911 [Planctomycetes bacterium ADurb.Bin126]|nr:MAG: hypothetical protein BWX88_02911 [Planctomycetes bacterium ADurb.Bin126]HOD83362.1 hypothetical protein [Phycisphaerae bacterium]HQL76098.1 hypothetical protein [Phycisphaerae bacterium]